MFRTWILTTFGLVMFSFIDITTGLDCKRSSVLKGTPCGSNGQIINKEDCEAMSPRCCRYSVGFLNCFINKDYEENQGNGVCNNGLSLYKQLSIANAEHDELHAFSSQILSKHKVVSELHCLDHCYRNHLCNVYNYQYNSERSVTRLCELLYEVERIETRRDFRYRMVDRNKRKILTNSDCKQQHRPNYD